MKTSMPVNVVVKMAMTHTTTYFVVGLIASTLFNYSGRYADPTVASLMRQTTSPLVASGPLIQVLRGALFGIAFYPLRDIVLARRTG